jgi:hypothetical protein
MSYIGSTPTTQSFLAGTDSFNGTGSATNFTLSRIVNSVNDIQVVVNNVVQYPPNYSVSGTTLTISPAPSSGTNNVYVRYLSTTLQTFAPSQGTVGISQLSATGTPSASTFLAGNNTWSTPGGGFSNISVGTYTAASNSSGSPLVWNSNGSLTFTVPTGITKVKVTVVGGGGGGSNLIGGCVSIPGGGGGAGGTAIEIISGLTPGGTVSVTVGAGGAAASAGGTSSFGAYCSATGGAASTNNSTFSAGGQGGIGSGGNLNIRGGSGQAGVSNPNSNGEVAGMGGSSTLGGGGLGRGNGSAGTVGGDYGGGGGGGGPGATTGLAGASGVVIVEY